MNKQYDVILADVPWDFKVWNKDTGSGRSAISHYNVMEFDAICKMPISQLASKNCVLFFWAVWPRIFDAEKVINCWGFKYKTKAFTWVKARKNGLGFSFGMGYYTRANDEPCLLATKGNMPVAVHDVSTIIYSPRREHSRKPDEQYEKIECLYPNMRYLELFARTKHSENWDVFGDQVADSISLESYAKV